MRASTPKRPHGTQVAENEVTRLPTGPSVAKAPPARQNIGRSPRPPERTPGPPPRSPPEHRRAPRLRHPPSPSAGRLGVCFPFFRWSQPLLPRDKSPTALTAAAARCGPLPGRGTSGAAGRGTCSRAGPRCGAGGARPARGFPPARPALVPRRGRHLTARGCTKPRAEAAPNRSAGAAPLASGPVPPLLRPGRRRASAQERRAAPSPRREIPVSGRGGRPCCFHHAPAGPQEGRAATQHSLPNFGNFPGRCRPKPGTGSPPAGPEPPPADGSGKANPGGGTRLEPERWRRLRQKPGAMGWYGSGLVFGFSVTPPLALTLHAFRAPWLSRRPAQSCSIFGTWVVTVGKRAQGEAAWVRRIPGRVPAIGTVPQGPASHRSCCCTCSLPLSSYFGRSPDRFALPQGRTSGTEGGGKAFLF